MVNPESVRSERDISGRWSKHNLRQRRSNHTEIKKKNVFSASSSSSSRRDLMPMDSTSIRVVRGTTDQRGKIIPTIHLHSPTRTETFDHYSSSSSRLLLLRRSSLKRKDFSGIDPTRSNEDFSSPSDPFTETTLLPIEQDISPSRRDSLTTTTTDSVKSEINRRAPSTPVDPRCDRAYSSTTKSINRQICDLLGPQLCSDCLELRTRTNLSAEHLPSQLIRRRLSALAIRRFLPEKSTQNEEEIFQLLHDQRIELNTDKERTDGNILSDQEYFDEMTQSLIEHCQRHPTPFLFEHFKDLQEKYSSNVYPRLHLDETPIPQSSNPLFHSSQLQFFDVSTKYSQMKRASTQRYPFDTKATIFVSPRKSQLFHHQHRFLNNSSPPLLLQTIQQTIQRNNSNPHLLQSNQISFNPRRTLIASKLPLN